MTANAETDAGTELAGLEGGLPGLGHSETDAVPPALTPTPLLAALEKVGGSHVYADTADVAELRDVLAVAGDGGPIHREVDGNTANQPLVRKVAGRYLAAGDVRGWAGEVLARRPDLPRPLLRALLYAALCARVGNDMRAAFAAGRRWDASLQLHMALCARPAAARTVGRILARMAPGALVKVPFTPDAPGCFLVARDLERMGIGVNFTSTFSARQAVAAALLADVKRTNVFMGRLDRGLEADLLGAHVDLEAQRHLRRLRRKDGVPTQLIVASLHDWRSFVHVAGCDVFTAPCEVLRDFLEQDELAAEQLESRLETSYEDSLGVSDHVLRTLGADRIARLYRVEPELIEFLRELRGRSDYAALGVDDGDRLHALFDAAGFGDLFHAPTPAETEELSRGKLPDLAGRLVRSVPLDTHYSLLANADFARHQGAIDREMEEHLPPERA